MKDYTKYSKPGPTQNEVVKVQENPNKVNKEEIAAEENPVKEDSKEPEVVSEDEIKQGTVVNCGSLNVRTKPIKESSSLTIIHESEMVLVNMNKSEEGWYKVTTKTNVEGFCMKQYINVV